jgi:DNA invertase Pin-like site-specific DNA recombinase
MNNQTKKFFIYTRKSTDDKDRQVRSISDQLSELKELARKEDLDIVDVFVEKQTAKIPGRPVFNEMMARMEAGEASGILAWHPDRLARNSVDGGKIIYLVDTGVIVEMKFPTFWFDPTPQGKFMLSIAFSQSKYYVDNLSENIKRGHRNKVKEGIWPQMSPLGYVNKNKRIVPDPEIAPLIKKTFEAYATGNFTLREVRDKFNTLGLSVKASKSASVTVTSYPTPPTSTIRAFPNFSAIVPSTCAIIRSIMSYFVAVCGIAGISCSVKLGLIYRDNLSN